MFKFLKKDSFILGIILGLVVPVIFFFLITLLNGQLLDNAMGQNTIMLISIVLNVFVFRYYLLNDKKDKTGRGVLISTFVYTIIFFILFWKSF
jgi:membrane protease YdiL (CAAX protease family)